MIHLRICRLSSTLVLLTLALLISTLAAAQSGTPPAWSQAYALGPRSSPTGAAVVDAAGNTYELSSLLTPANVAGTILNSQGGTDVYLAKYTPAGALAWVRQLGSANDDQASGLTLDAAGNVYVAGTFSGASISLGNGLSLTGSSFTVQKLFVVRYSPQGTPEWVQQSAANSSTHVAGGGIGLDAAGTVYVGGIYNSSVTIGGTTLSSNTPAAFVVRLDRNSGALVGATKAYEYSSFGGFLYSPALTVAPAGDYYLLTTFDVSPVVGPTPLTSRGLLDVLITHFSAAGTIEWARQLGSTGNDSYSNAKVDALGNLYLAGRISGPATLDATSIPHSGGNDGYLLKYSPPGTLQWVHTLAGPGSDALSGLAVDAAGNAYVVGTFVATAQLGTSSLTSAGNNDVVVGAYTPQGQLRWVQQAGGPGFDSGTSAGLDAAGNLRVLGLFGLTCAFSPLSLTSTAPLPETFLAQLGNTPLATRPALAAQPLSFYPNPATDQLHLPALPAGTPVQLVDALGRVAREARVAAGTVSVQGLVAGLYQLRALDAQGRPCAGRVLVQ